MLRNVVVFCLVLFLFCLYIFGIIILWNDVINIPLKLKKNVILVNSLGCKECEEQNRLQIKVQELFVFSNQVRILKIMRLLTKNGYRKISNIRRTKSPNLDASRLVVQLSSPNPMKPGVKSRMKM